MRKYDWLFYFSFTCLVLCYAYMLSFQSMPTVWYWGWGIKSLLVVGLWLFIISGRVSIKQKKFFALGERTLRKCSYCLIAAGAVLTLLFMRYVSKL